MYILCLLNAYVQAYLVFFRSKSALSRLRDDYGSQIGKCKFKYLKINSYDLYTVCAFQIFF